MWKYISQEQCNEFLLSLNLIQEEISDKEKLKKLYSISNKIEKNYKVFKIKKRNGKYRTIYEPNRTLKKMQQQILKNILNNKKISSYAKAYHKGISLKENALVHQKKEQILKLDIKDFFNNIHFLDVYQSCFSIEYFPKSIGMLLTYLCTYNDYLPQGAPTSAAISNLVMKDFDEEMGAWCQENNIAYTRYSDDLTFSGNINAKEIITKVKKELSPLGLQINPEKIHFISKNKQQKITGIVVNEKVQVAKTYRHQIRQEMYYIKKYGLVEHMKYKNVKLDADQYVASLKGRIEFVLQIDNQNKEFLKYKKELKK